jgi:hypothetical protein
MKKRPVKLASVPWQIIILLWKNSILFRRNFLATFLELFCPLLILSILLIMRYFIEKISINDQKLAPQNVFAFVNEIFQLTLQSQFSINRLNRDVIAYFPDNLLIRSVVSKAAALIATHNNGFYPKSMN